MIFVCYIRLVCDGCVFHRSGLYVCVFDTFSLWCVCVFHTSSLLCLCVSHVWVVVFKCKTPRSWCLIVRHPGRNVCQTPRLWRLSDSQVVVFGCFNWDVKIELKMEAILLLYWIHQCTNINFSLLFVYLWCVGVCVCARGCAYFKGLVDVIV